MEDFERILLFVERGVPRDLIAEHEGIKIESLNQRMRRAGYRWDEMSQSYVSLEVPMGQHIVNGQVLPPRIAHVLSMMRSVTADPNEVARVAHYRDVGEMAADLKRHGLIWSSEKHNYIPQETARYQELPSHDLIGSNVDDAKNNDNKPVIEIKTIPRYQTRSKKGPKTLSMSFNLQEMLRHVSSMCSITQGEIVEIAFIEFCLKYGYEKEMATLLE